MFTVRAGITAPAAVYNEICLQNVRQSDCCSELLKIQFPTCLSNLKALEKDPAYIIYPAAFQPQSSASERMRSSDECLPLLSKFCSRMPGDETDKGKKMSAVYFPANIDPRALQESQEIYDEW